MKKLSAPTALKKYIVEFSCGDNWSYDGALNTEEEIEAAYQQMRKDIGFDWMQDVMSGHFETGLPVESKMYSRYCETKMVGIETMDKNFIGFPRYFGGGKHFDEYSWYDTSVDFAEYLDCKEEQKLVTVRTFSKKP